MCKAEGNNCTPARTRSQKERVIYITQGTTQNKSAKVGQTLAGELNRRESKTVF